VLAIQLRYQLVSSNSVIHTFEFVILFPMKIYKKYCWEEVAADHCYLSMVWYQLCAFVGVYGLFYSQALNCGVYGREGIIAFNNTPCQFPPDLL